MTDKKIQKGGGGDFHDCDIKLQTITNAAADVEKMNGTYLYNQDVNNFVILLPLPLMRFFLY